MKGYYIEITNNLLDGKHRNAMRESVWLFMWFLDKMTSISEEGIGKVLGGKPIIFEEVTEDLGISRRTYARWIKDLHLAGYINFIRTPKGLSISINKAKKTFRPKGVQRMGKTPQRDVPYSPSDVPEMVRGYAINGTSNIRQYKDNTKTGNFSFKVVDNSEYIQHLKKRTLSS